MLAEVAVEEVVEPVNVGLRGVLRRHVVPSCEIIRRSTAHLRGVSVEAFEGLLVDRARAQGAAALVRGLRQVGDFDYEFRMAFANRKLYPDVETVLFMTSEAHAFVSASIVREVHRWGGDVSMFVPPPVVEALSKKRSAFGETRA